MKGFWLPALGVVLLSGVSAAAQPQLALQFSNARVTLNAQNVPVRQILVEWARLGGTRIINGDQVSGAPVTLQLIDVPERQALATILRDVKGYMLSLRESGARTASMYGLIFIMQSSVPPPALATAPRAPTSLSYSPVPPPMRLADDDGDVQAQGMPAARPPIGDGPSTSGAGPSAPSIQLEPQVFTGTPLAPSGSSAFPGAAPTSSAQTTPTPGAPPRSGVPGETTAATPRPAGSAPPVTGRGSPFGVPGSGTPGAIEPVPPPPAAPPRPVRTPVRQPLPRTGPTVPSPESPPPQ